MHEICTKFSVGTQHDGKTSVAPAGEVASMRAPTNAGQVMVTRADRSIVYVVNGNGVFKNRGHDSLRPGRCVMVVYREVEDECM